MPRGRPRTFAPNMPAHIDPRRLPKGAYWDARDCVWYTKLLQPTVCRKRIAGPKATLADLHRILEDIHALERGTVRWLLDLFHGSPKFAGLAPSTQAQYLKQADIAKALPTKQGALGVLIAARLTVPIMQKLFDEIGAKTPTKANHLLRYLRRVFSWGIARGHCTSNPCKGVEQARERKRRRLPETDVFQRLVDFARARGERVAHSAGSCSPYLWMVMEIGYLCRLRPIETLTLTDAQITTTGVQAARRKGSNDSLVEWNPRLRSAVDAAIALRKVQTTATPTQLRAEHRLLFVAQDGAPLSKSGLDSAWQRLITSAIAAGVMTPQQRFGLHDLKRKGITDTPGTRGEKQRASGHKNAAMLDIYDYSVPSVKPAGECQ